MAQFFSFCSAGYATLICKVHTQLISSGACITDLFFQGGDAVAEFHVALGHAFQLDAESIHHVSQVSYFNKHAIGGGSCATHRREIPIVVSKVGC